MIWFNPIHIGFNKKKVFGIMENILMTYQYFLFQNKFTSLLIFIWTKGARTVVISHKIMLLDKLVMAGIIVLISND